MKKLMYWLEHSFAPTMNKINRNVWILTLKDSVLQTLPFILLGSIFCVGAVVENYISLPFSFWTPFGWTMGMVSLLMAFLIPFNFCEKKRLRKQRLIAGSTGLIFFLITINPVVIAEGAPGFGSSAFGAGGMFVAMVTGMLTCVVFNLFGKFSFFKEESAIPDFVRQWFDSLLPIFIVVFGGFVVVQLLNVNLYTIVTALFAPLGNILNTWYGFVLMTFFYCFIYSMGISSWVLSPVTSPVEIQSATTNMALAAAGTATASNLLIYNKALIYSAYMWIGGIACTLPLVFLLMASKSNKLKALGRASLVPGIFNINEPVIFGCIVWNPVMMVPMWIIGIVVPAITWIFTKVIPFAPIPTLLFDLWYCPFPISTWLTTRSFSAIILMLIIFVVAGLIWFPFFKVYEKQCVEEEAAAVVEEK